MARFLLFVLGVLVGAVGVGGWILSQGGDLVVHEVESPVGLEQTVNRIKAAAEKEGWVVKSVMALDESVRKNGGGVVLPVRVINVCHGKHAGRILAQDEARKVSVMMPCRLSVYTKQNGKTYISSFNAGVVGRLFPAVVADVMGGPVADAQKGFIDAAVSPAGDGTN